MIAEHKLISEEIRDWSEKVLEVPSDEFNGLPPCPYAKRAWDTGNVRFNVIEDVNECIEIKDKCPDDESVDIVAWTKFDKMTSDEFDQWIDDQNENHNGTWIIGFHPDHPEDEALEEYQGNGAPEYALILIQSLRHLSESSKKIFNKGYYDKYSQPDINHIKERNIS